MSELWHDIVGYEGEYQVSNWGNVRSLDRTIIYSNGNKRFYSGQILKTYFAKNGYECVALMRNHRKKTFLVHRLVAIAFIPNPEELPEINHLDEDKSNNCVWNLEWCTTVYNRNYGTRNERASQNKDYARIGIKLREAQGKKVLQIDATGKIIRIWSSIRQIERETGYKRSFISGCCNNKYTKAYGYKWLFYKE